MAGQKKRAKIFHPPTTANNKAPSTSTACGRKITGDYKASDSAGYRLFHLETLFRTLRENLCCKKCGGSITLSEVSLRGLGGTYGIACENCVQLKTLKSGPTIDNTRGAFEINRRAILAMRCIGQGLESLATFCGVMDLPSAVKRPTYNAVVRHMVVATSQVANTVFQQAVEEQVETAAKAETRNITVQCDGTWQRRGYKSLNGVCTVIGSATGKYNPGMHSLVLMGNALTELDPGSLPPLLKHLHLGKNSLDSLNRTLRDLNQLEWLFLNENELTSLDRELPMVGHNLRILHVSNNKLTHLPSEFRRFHRLDALFLHNNRIRSLDRRLQKARHLERLTLYCNELQELAEDDFTEVEHLEDLQLGHNSIKSLGRSIGNRNGNSALWPLRSLKCLNLTHNELREFSFSDLRGLRELRLVDVSHNRIAYLIKGRTATENLVEAEGEEIAGSSILELRLQHNKLSSLAGSLFMGMSSLQRLNLSHNALGPTLGSRDLKGLDALRVLDLSHNALTTLEDTSETWLPSLEELHASHNRLVVLTAHDFRGLPVLCWADMSMNWIRSLTADLVAHTRCTVHGVPDVLRIYLQDNPVLCEPSLINLTVTLEVNHAKVYGIANDCPATTTTPGVPTSALPPLPPTLFLTAAGGNVSFAATLE